jgi:hypothetical protein
MVAFASKLVLHVIAGITEKMSDFGMLDLLFSGYQSHLIALSASPTQWLIHKGGLSAVGSPLQFSLLTATKTLKIQLRRSVK